MSNKDLTIEDTKHVGELARIKLSDEELPQFTSQMNEILKYFKKLEEIDTTSVEPTYHVLDLKNVTRPDRITKSLPVKEGLQNAPKTKDNYFIAPKIK